MPAHAVIRKIRERVAERGKLPVEDGENSRLVRMENQVVHAVIAVDHRRFVARRNVFRQPGDQSVHGLDWFGLRSPVLPAPAPDLPREIVARFSEIREACSRVIYPVERRDHAVHLRVDRGALGRRHARKRRVPQHAALDVLHDVERAPDDALVLAQAIGARHGNARLSERRDHAELALHRVRRGKELRRRTGLGAQHVVFSRAADQIGRVRLAAFELPHGERPGESVLAEIALQRSDVEALVLLYRHRAGGLPAHAKWPPGAVTSLSAERHSGRVFPACSKSEAQLLFLLIIIVLYITFPPWRARIGPGPLPAVSRVRKRAVNRNRRETMETVIVALQTLCFAGLALGTALSIYQLMQRDKDTDRFSYAVANDFETGFRRLARSRR